MADLFTFRFGFEAGVAAILEGDALTANFSLCDFEAGTAAFR